MNARLFWPLLGLGLVISLSAALLQAALAPLLGQAFTLRALAVLIGLAYLLGWSRLQSPASGRAVLALLWLSGTALLLLFNPSLAIWWTVQAIALFMLRLPAHRQLWPIAADAALSATAVLLGMAALWHSHSLGLGLWTFALVQAFCAFLPAAVAAPREADAFADAERTAEAALQQLARSR